MWCRNYWTWINKITLPVFSVRAGSNSWLQYRLIFSNWLRFTTWKFVRLTVLITESTLHSLCQECIKKFTGQHCIKDQHCAEQHASSVDEEFHPVKSGACGYYLKRSLEPKFITFTKVLYISDGCCTEFNIYYFKLYLF